MYKRQLWGLCGEGSGVAYCALQARHVSAGQLSELLVRTIGRGSPVSLTPDDLTPRSRRILERAAQQARKNGCALAGTEYILASILAERESFAVRFLEEIGAVSYTHLDVYKRQAAGSGSEADGESGTFAAGIAGDTQRTAVPVGAQPPPEPSEPHGGGTAHPEHRLIPVSYTHLDVYKRQITLCAGFLAPYISDDLLNMICMVGYAIVICIGLNLLMNAKIKTANLLPAMIVPVLNLSLIHI